MSKKENQINALTDEDLIYQLKQKALPVFGTRQEKLDRLKKANGIISSIQNNIPELKKKPSKNISTVEKIQQMEKRREERRSKMIEAKRDKEEKMLENQISGRNELLPALHMDKRVLERLIQ
ncbi:kinesin motor domain protein [Ichthyophthirius multifiliis]|uniref:Kinesin motor domain protein n=1 Tax=Ichthyophthirius multifiliis TaxID=5932 RepID=G0QZI9_ICHMU|nr:kinesin motor domain protein [Ichthyophthirius multifiliis]EGR29378.1 kinesin motor domain protein [Ichthyophthirius multifiliis]|eukprot:XP_004030614.1 kinesin motor domain protein [Ichthyophthirius multifiliis]